MIPMPGHLFALALFTAVGVSHTIRPRIWREYVAWLVTQGHAGVALYASLHALPGAVLLALAGTNDFTGVILTIVGVAHVFKGTLYSIVPGFGLRKMQWGLTLPMSAWSAAGAVYIILASVALLGMIA